MRLSPKTLPYTELTRDLNTFLTEKCISSASTTAKAKKQDRSAEQLRLPLRSLPYPRLFMQVRSSDREIVGQTGGIRTLPDTV